VTPRAVREYVEALRPRYVRADRADKGRILSEFCRTTGYHRVSAIRLFGRCSSGPGERRGRPAFYGPEEASAIKRLHEASGQMCSKLFVPFLPRLLEALERCGEIELSGSVRERVLRVSASTVDRLLAPSRLVLPRRPYAQSRAASAIQALVPVRTFSEWEGTEVGSLQMDLVSHCGESTEGFYLTTLVAVDVAVGWSEPRVVWGKGKSRVGGAAEGVRRALPFRMREIHTDNGGEFINDALYPWARRNGIGFTRGRPYKKNDQAVVEQKNWTLVRKLVGYDRYSSKAAYQVLERLYRSLRLYANFFQPLRKLIGKERVGAKVKKRYDRARTPYERLLEAGVLGEEKRGELERLYQKLNPVGLRREIDEALELLWKLAERSGDGRIEPLSAKTASGRQEKT
jgi:hypothetical protein